MENNGNIGDEIYHTITNKRFFEKEILNNESEFYYYFKIQEYTKYKNSQLLKNEKLISKIEILRVFNNKIQSLMFQIISCYKVVVECKKANTQVNIESLQIRLTSELEYLKTAVIPSINLIYDQNNLLAYNVNEYCINGFKMMFDKLYDENCINIKQSPLYSKIEKVYNKYLNLFDVEKMKVLSKPITETEPTPKEPASENEQNKTSKKIEFSFVNEFDNVNSKAVFDYFKKELVDKNYLSLEDLEDYLKLSFEKKELPKEKFILKQNKTLRVIQAIFYNYFLNIAYKPNGRRPEYIKLLTDYFQGFEYDKVKNNFNK